MLKCIICKGTNCKEWYSIQVNRSGGVENANENFTHTVSSVRKDTNNIEVICFGCAKSITLALIDSRLRER